MKITFLGTGTSVGVPAIGCNCRVCTSTDPKNKRMRCSICVQTGSGKNILVDTATELRLQAIANNISQVEMVLFTHFHADHVFGLDDVRRFNTATGQAIPCYGDAKTIDGINKLYSYCLNHQIPGPLPLITPTVLSGELSLEEVKILPVPIRHGWLDIIGYRFNNVAYLTDCKEIPSDSMAKLDGLEILVLGALRHREHPTHFTLSQATAKASEIGAKRTYFTHISHELEHQEVNESLPEGMALAHDGLVVEV